MLNVIAFWTYKKELLVKLTQCSLIDIVMFMIDRSVFTWVTGHMC